MSRQEIGKGELGVEEERRSHGEPSPWIGFIPVLLGTVDVDCRVANASPTSMTSFAEEVV
jgi:hypothetical protein